MSSDEKRITQLPHLNARKYHTVSQRRTLVGSMRAGVEAAESVDERLLFVVGGGGIIAKIIEESIELDVRLLSKVPSRVILGRRVMAQHSMSEHGMRDSAV